VTWLSYLDLYGQSAKSGNLIGASEYGMIIE
jgi:hypothetical protein